MSTLMSLQKHMTNVGVFNVNETQMNYCSFLRNNTSLILSGEIGPKTCLIMDCMMNLNMLNE